MRLRLLWMKEQSRTPSVGEDRPSSRHTDPLPGARLVRRDRLAMRARPRVPTGDDEQVTRHRLTASTEVSTIRDRASPMGPGARVEILDPGAWFS